ncbi:hypothetical protein UFOVP163_38 [uncultured Caudovirales phage]|uniref:Uncharacterized protein n=1 Tax=uncultured Caudovirales phage TaxID=2100421 RepID=A0A6J7WFH1_9CAUD|nr:hypothetical protein UFOVP163_38 [uncultured Caudovirales phage]
MADTNFNFDLSNFNKGIDEIQKRIQQMSAALKVATDPKVVNNLTTSIKEATSELDKLKSSIAGVGSAINTIPNIGNAISNAMNLATTSMNAMVGSSANLVANLQQAQTLSIRPFVQAQNQAQTTINNTTTSTPKSGPAGGVQFGAGGDFNPNQIRTLTEEINNMSISRFGSDWDKLTSKMSSDIKAASSNVTKLTDEMDTFGQTIVDEKSKILELSLEYGRLAGEKAKLNHLYDQGVFDENISEYTTKNKELEDEIKRVTTETKNQEKVVSDLQSQYGNLGKTLDKAKASFDRLVDSKKNIPKDEIEYLKTVSGEYGKLSKKYYDARMMVLDYNTAINELQNKQTKGETLTNKEASALEKYRSQLAATEKKLSEYQDKKSKVEQQMGGSGGKSRFTNELFSAQQLLREMPAFTYSFQTGLLALSNNIPIFVDDVKRMAGSIDATTGKALGFKESMKLMGKELVSFTGLATIAVSIITVFGPMIWEWITGTKALTEAQKELNKELKNANDAYNDNIAKMNSYISVLNSSLTTDEQKIVALRELEDLTGRDLVKSYDSMTASIKAANEAGQTYLSTMRQQIELDRNMVKVKFATNKILDAEAVIRGVQKKDPKLYKEQKDVFEKMSITDLEYIIPQLDDISGAFAKAILDIKKYTGSLNALGVQYSKTIGQGSGDVNKKIAGVIRAEELALQEDLAALAKKGVLTDEKVTEMTIASKKKTILEIRKLNKDASKKNNMFIFQEEEKLWLEVDNLGRKAAKKAAAAVKDVTQKTYEEKEADIEKQLVEDYRNILNLRLQLTKDSYEKEANIITEKYNELDEKAKQRHIDEMKILEEAFNTRVDFQEREANIKETAGKMTNQDAAQRYSEIELEKLKQFKKKEFEIFKETDSQSVRSNEFLTRTIYLNHRNLYQDLLKLANKFALDQEAFNRTFDKKLLLRNIIANDETLKIQKQQLENLYDELEQIKEKRTFTFFEQPKETTIFVDWKKEAFKFTQNDIPKIQEDLATALKNNPADRMIGVWQLALQNFKGKTIDVFDIFKETTDKMSVLQKQKALDLTGVTDPKEIEKINQKYKDLTKLAEYYIESLKTVEERNKGMVVLAEDADKYNSLKAKEIALLEIQKQATEELRIANEDLTSTENVEANKRLTIVNKQLESTQKEIDALKLKPIAPANIDKEAFKLAIKKFNEDLQADPNATITIAPSPDVVLGKFRKTLDEAKAALEGGDMKNFNELLSKAFDISEAIQKKLTPEEKKALKESFDTIYNEAAAVAAQKLDTKKAEIVKGAAEKSGFNTEGVPKEFKRSELWRQDKVNLDIKKAELEHDREMLQVKISSNMATEEEIIAFHKREMDLIQEQKTRLSNIIKDTANSIGGIFQTTFDAISTMAQNAMSLENEHMATMQANSDNMISSYDRQIAKLKEMTETQIMTADERVNAEQKILDFERLKEQERKNQQIRVLELQKKQVETNKKLALAQAAISGGVALANVVAIATEGAAAGGPAAPFIFAAELAAGIGAVVSSISSATNAINSSDAQIATIDAQISGIEASYQEGLNKGAGVTSGASAGTGPSAPLTTFNASLVNQGQSSANYNVNDTLGGYKIYVTQADIQNANNQATKIKKKVTFG